MSLAVMTTSSNSIQLSAETRYYPIPTHKLFIDVKTPHTIDLVHRPAIQIPVHYHPRTLMQQQQE